MELVNIALNSLALLSDKLKNANLEASNAFLAGVLTTKFANYYMNLAKDISEKGSNYSLLIPAEELFPLYIDDYIKELENELSEDQEAYEKSNIGIQKNELEEDIISLRSKIEKYIITKEKISEALANERTN